MTTVDLALTGGTVVLDGRRQQCTLGVTNEVISHITNAELDAQRTVDVDGKLLLPGCVDGHVHIRPGDEREGVDTGTAAAAAGGVTTVVDMPNFPPTVTNRDRFEETAARYEGSAHVDYGIFGHVPTDIVGTGDIGALADAGAPAFKTFLSLDGGPGPYVILDKGDLYTAFEEVAETNRPFWVHAEDDDYHREFIDRVESQGLSGWDAFFESAPPILETTAVADLIDLACETGVTTVVAHTTTADALEAISDARADGVPIYAETTPYYLGVDQERLRDIGTEGLGTPPVRSPANRERLWDCLNDGSVDTIATDHAPNRLKEKSGSPTEVSPGMPQLETALPFLLTAANDGRTTVERIVELYAERPAKLFGLYPTKGTLAVGADADIVVADMDTEWTVDPDDFESSAKYSAFDGWTFSARIARTFVRGVEVATDMTATDATPGQRISGAPPQHP
jgi:allantoinase